MSVASGAALGLVKFLTHPNEFIDEERVTTEVQRRASNFIGYLLGDVLRHRLKVRNLGAAALPIYERELDFFRREQYSFITCKDMYNKLKP